MGIYQYGFIFEQSYIIYNWALIYIIYYTFMWQYIQDTCDPGSPQSSLFLDDWHDIWPFTLSMYTLVQFSNHIKLVKYFIRFYLCFKCLNCVLWMLYSPALLSLLYVPEVQLTYPIVCTSLIEVCNVSFRFPRC